MSQATRPNDRHIIWSNQNLDVDDWREDYKEFLEVNELDDDPNDEQALYEWMEETNYDYLSDERVNLNVQLSQPIIVIGDIGRWNGSLVKHHQQDDLRTFFHFPMFYPPFCSKSPLLLLLISHRYCGCMPTHLPVCR